MSKRTRSMKLIVAVMIPAIMPLGVNPSSAATAPRTYLCTAGNYILLADVITNAAGVTISSAIPGALVGGNSPAELAGLSSSELGTVANETSTAQHLAAIEDLRLAMISVASLASTGAQLISGELSVDHTTGSAAGTFTPGVYKTATALNAVAGTTITLYGAGNYYFIAGAALTLGASVTMNFTGGALSQNVYWIAGSTAGDMGIGANSNVAGNFLARGTATFGAGAHLTGRLLVLNTVTFAANVSMDGLPADTTCTPQLFNVPPLIDQLSSPAQDLIKINFTVGTIKYTGVGATLLNDGKVASYSPTVPQVAGTAIDYVLYKYVTPPNQALSIVYTDQTLVDGRAGQPYSGHVAAKTLIGTSDSSQIVAFSVSGTIPAGLTFQTSGYFSGTIATSTIAKAYPLIFTATSNGYEDKTLPLTLNVAAALIIPAVTSIIFTDISLIDGRAGDSYSDSVVAKTTSDGSYNGLAVNYVMSGNAPQGLSFNQNSGYLTGIIAATAAVGDYSLSFTASSSGYTNVILSTSLRVTAAASQTGTGTANPAVLGIIFTDITLVDGRAGDPYSDFVQAKGISGGAYSGVVVNYQLTGALPLGLSFNPSTGYITGTISTNAIVGTYNVSIAAMSNGYPTQNLGFTFRVAAAPVIVVVQPVIPAAPKTIVFTDLTLVNGHVGRSYADYVKARAFVGSVSNNEKVTYSLTGILPEGLSFSKSTGYITGSIAKTATPGIYKINVSAYASGYVTAQQPYEFTIVPAVVQAVAKPLPVVTPTPIATTATKLSLLGTVWFDSGKSVLLPSSKMSLDLMVKALKGTNTTKLTVYGYTDAVTGKSHSVLSLARANVVKKYLLTKNKALVITTKGLGIAITSASSKTSIQASRMARVWM